MVRRHFLAPDSFCVPFSISGFRSIAVQTSATAMKPRSILLASHGSDGARAAEEAALDLLGDAGTLFHLVVVPDFWKGMMGDDWLNNAVTRARFGKYVEDQLAREIGEEVARLASSAEKRNITYVHDVRLGKPAECLAEAEDAGTYDLVVIGMPRPRGAPGLRSRMTPEILVRSLKTPLLVVPHPD
jgi:nucleotide-binding universal stress UspA family protein